LKKKFEVLGSDTQSKPKPQFSD